MDSIINKAKQQVSSGGGAAQPQQGAGTGAAAGAGAGGQQEDYGDKAFDALAKKSGHNVDRNTSEKITDGARGAFEKVTGKKVNPKISN